MLILLFSHVESSNFDPERVTIAPAPPCAGEIEVISGEKESKVYAHAPTHVLRASPTQTETCCSSPGANADSTSTISLMRKSCIPLRRVLSSMT
eukprot:1421755-Rhodomonas_salina.1